MVDLSEREREVLELIPYDRWVDQLSLETSKVVLSKLYRSKLVKRKVIANPSRDPRLGMLYKRYKATV